MEASTSLGYALTVFRSQGITVDHTFGLGGDSLYQEAGYTQLSRGRLSNRLYVASPENPRWEIGHLEDDVTRRDALQSLKEALSQSREQTMAQDRLPVWPVLQPDAMAATYRQHAELEQWLAVHAPTDLTDQLADLCDRVSQPQGWRGWTCRTGGEGRHWWNVSESAASGSQITTGRSVPGPSWRRRSSAMSTGSGRWPPSPSRTT